MNTLTSWKDLFEAALIESDPERLPERIEQAKTAILERVDQVDDPERLPDYGEILLALSRLYDLVARSECRDTQLAAAH